ncbi:hypothetical protein LCGC14_2717110, partial [marine sediment metagenome]
MLNVEMDKNGSFFNYTYGGVTALGRYRANGIADIGGVDSDWNYPFEVTPSGSSDPTSGQGSFFLMTFGTIFFMTLFFFALSVMVKGAIRFGFIGFSFVCGLITI